MKAHLDNRLQQGYKFDFGQYISNGFKFMHENIGEQIGFAALSVVVLIVAGIIPIVGNLATNLFLTDCLNLGFALGITYYLRNRHGNFNSYWGGFKFIGNIIVFRLIVIALSIILIAPLFFTALTDLINYAFEISSRGIEPDPEYLVYLIQNSIVVIFFASLIVGFLLTPMIFAPFFIAFHGLNGWNAIVYSYKFFSKKWLATYALVLVSGLIFVVGFLMLLVGALYTYPVMRNILFACFMDITDFHPERENREGIPDNSDLIDTNF